MKSNAPLFAFCLAFVVGIISSPITLPLYQESNPCSPYEYTCKSGKCISQYAICDAYKDCSDGEDENITMCLERPCVPDYPYKCMFNGKCIPISWLCDGFNDCGDYADEVKLTCAKALDLEGVVKVSDPNELEPRDDDDL